MERYCEKWKLGKTEILLDGLPVGKFIEIEEKNKLRDSENTRVKV